MEQNQASKRLLELQEFLPEVDRDLHRNFDFEVEDVRDHIADPDAPAGTYTMRGHAAVYDKWSLDLGGFRERIARGAFDGVLSEDPHVVHTWDHSTLHVLSSTRNKTLELRVDPAGLHYWSKVAPTSYAADLRILLERGDISQSSFAFTVDEDQWDESDGVIERTILKIAGLFDVTTTAMGAYPTTDSVLAARSVRSLVSGRNLTPVMPAALAETDPEDETRAAPSEDTAPEAEATASPEEPEAAPAKADPEAARKKERDHEDWQAKRRAEYLSTREFAFGVDPKRGKE